MANDPVEQIINQEFSLTGLTCQFDKAAISDQEALPNNKISFPDALRAALKTILTSNSSRESPRIIIAEGLGLSLTTNDKEVNEKLREFLVQGSIRLLPNEDWSDYDREYDYFPPEEREPAADNWVFFLKLPTLSDHLYWVIVPRDGQQDAYIYGFN